MYLRYVMNTGSTPDGGFAPLAPPPSPSDPPKPSPDPDEELVCPECGVPTASVNIERHAELHWPDLAHLNNPTYWREHALAQQVRDKLLAGGVTRADHSRLKTTGKLED